jgi:putative FmdB family regulatory protein
MDALQKMSDEPLVDCPSCNQAALRKLVSAAGFRLKGEGWYETDFKSGSKKNLADSGNTDSAKKSKAACGTSCGCH